MTTLNWQPSSPFDAIVFDCDGTLSAIEGIDELAKSNGVAEKVESLTANAMKHTGLNVEIYRTRLDLVRPRYEQVIALGQHYFQHQVPHVSHVIQLLSRLNKAV